MTDVSDDLRIAEIIGDEKQFRQFVALRLTALTRDMKSIQENGCQRYEDHKRGVGPGAAAGLSAFISGVVIALVEYFKARP